MQGFELGVLDWIQLHCRTGFLDAAMPVISALCGHGEVWILLAVILLAIKKHRKTGAVLILALALDVICCNMILKPLVARPRPFAYNELVELLVARPADWAFPSGHTAASFAAVGALLAEKSRLWKPAFALAVMIAFSRLYLYVHWPSDVLAGALLGTALGFAASRLIQCLKKRLPFADP